MIANIEKELSNASRARLSNSHICNAQNRVKKDITTTYPSYCKNLDVFTLPSERSKLLERLYFAIHFYRSLL